MSNLDFVSSISATFVDEINKFITTFTNTIKQQFEDLENKVVIQTNEINKLKDDLKSKKFDENNYTSVSVIKNQDKQIHELSNTIKTLENRIKFLEMKAIKEPIIQNIITPELDTPITSNSSSNSSSHQATTFINKDVEINSDMIENLHPVMKQEVELVSKLAIESETIPTQIQTHVPAKKIIKKTGKKVNEEIEQIENSNTNELSDPIVPVDLDTVVEKPKRKIPLKKPTKKDLKVKEEIKDEIKEEIKDEVNDANEIENQRLEDEKLAIENQRLEDEKLANDLKNKKLETKKEPKQTTKKDTKKEKEVKIEAKIEAKIETPEVNYPDTIPDLDSVIILEFDNIDYYLDEKTNNIFQITEDEEIGIFIGLYDKDNKKILKMNS